MITGYDPETGRTRSESLTKLVRVRNRCRYRRSNLELVTRHPEAHVDNLEFNIYFSTKRWRILDDFKIWSRFLVT